MFSKAKTIFSFPKKIAEFGSKNFSKIFEIKYITGFSLFTGISLYYAAMKENKNAHVHIIQPIHKTVSSIFGYIASCELPEFSRYPIFSIYSYWYQVNSDEMIEKDLYKYKTLSEFFTRKIIPRPLSDSPEDFTSPADSRVLSFNEVLQDQNMTVKGRSYSIGELLTGIPKYQVGEQDFKEMKKNLDTKLFQIILYLAPGDYHRFHSPGNFKTKSMLHVNGLLLPVNLKSLNKRKTVYEINERVNLFGTWDQGFLAMSFVGALNVGSIIINNDNELKTNSSEKKKQFGKQWESQFKKGEEIGKFNLGSTIVMVFEAKSNFEWNVVPGQKIVYGHTLGSTKKTSTQIKIKKNCM